MIVARLDYPEPVTFVIDLARIVLLVLMLMMLGRVLLSWVFAYSRDWRPAGFAALAVEAVYSTTDPLIKPLRKVFPPITLGRIRLDVAFLLVFLVIIALNSFLEALSYSV